MNAAGLEDDVPFHHYARALKRLDADTRRHVSCVLDLDRFLFNADQLRLRAQGVPLRVATKSLRIRGALTTALERPGFSGALAYTLAEALWLHEHGIDDLLVGYPESNAAALTQWAQDPQARRNITVTVDSLENVRLVLDAARSATQGVRQEPLRICIDLDLAWMPTPGLHLGPYRSPVRTESEAAALARAVVAHPELRLVGVLGYEGQVAATPDAGSLLSPMVRAAKQLVIRDVARRRARMVAAIRGVCRQAGQALEFVNGGGTGSLDSTVQDRSVTEASVGSGLIGPALFDNYAEFHPRPSLYFVRPVVRRPTPHTVTVSGGGLIASGPPSRSRRPTIAWPLGLRYARLEGPGEVQTPLHGKATSLLQMGDPVFFRHAKSGELAEHTNLVAVYSEAAQDIVDLWPTYRGEGKAFSA
ncbi:MAG: alanine racemase [Micrococcaceae bacterium]